MSSVYGGSSLNIAASGAVDGSSGCFLQQLHTWRCLVEANVGEQLECFQCLPFEMYYDSLSRGPLAGRGWAVQERLLPARTLHFTPTQLIWECHTRTACESFPEEEFPAPLIEADHFWKKQPVNLSLWSFIVRSYSSCSLTYSKDKFVAISGLARIIQDQTGDEYVAGMWRKNLDIQLCWVVMAAGRRIVPYEAPTWSWASLENCTIDFPDSGVLDVTRERSTIWIIITGVHLQSSAPDPLGQLAMAKLCISCSCLLHVTILNGNSMNIADKTVDFYGFFDCTDDAPDLPYRCFAMPVYGGPIDCGDTTQQGMCGLFLQPTGQQQGQYRRVRRLKILTHRNGYNGMELFKDAANDPSCQATSSDCIQFSRKEDGKPNYTIDII